MNRNQLIDQKHQVIAQLRQARRELERERQSESRYSAQRIRELERHVEALMAEEHRLRLAIDRSR